MSETYRRIVDCLDRNDYQCLVSLAGTAEFRFILDELERRGFKRDDVVAAVAAGSLEAVDWLRRTTIDIATRVNTLAGLVNGGRFVDAVAFVVENPGVVDALSVLAGRSESFEDFVAGLAVGALESGLERWADLRRVCGRDRRAAEALFRAVRSYVLSAVDRMCREGRFQDAVALINRVLVLAVDDRERSIARDATVLALGAGEPDERSAQDLISLARGLGIVTDEHDRAVQSFASRVEEEVVASVLEGLVHEISGAVSGGKVDVQRIRSLLSGYGDVIRTVPLTIIDERSGATVSVPGASLYQYLDALVVYVERVRPNLDVVATLVNDINSSLQRGDVEGAARLSGALQAAVQILRRYISTQAFLRYVSSYALGQQKTLSAAEREIDEELRYYENVAGYVRTVYDVYRLCNERVCDRDRATAELDKLRQFFGLGLGAEDLYTEWRFALSASLIDVASLLGLAPATPLVQELSSRGALQRLLSDRRDLLSRVVYRAVAESIPTDSRGLAVQVLREAVARGLDGDLRIVLDAVNAMERVSGALRRLDSIRQTMERVESIRLARTPAGIGRSAEEVKQGALSKLAQDYVDAAVSAVAEIRQTISQYGSSLDRFRVSLPDGRSATLRELFESYIREIWFGVLVTNELLMLSSFVQDRLGALRTEADLGRQNEIIASIVARIVESQSRVSRYGSSYGKDVGATLRYLDDLRGFFGAIQGAVLNAKQIDDYTRDFLRLVGDGFRHPEETPRAINLWQNAVSGLLNLKAVAEGRATAGVSGGERIATLMGIARSMYESYSRYLSELKSSLVENDIRLEEVLNTAESRAGLRIDYTRPYFTVPIVGELERYIKIGIKQVSDWMQRIPTVGGVVASFWEGLSSAVLSLALPYEAYQQLLFISAGAGEVGNRLIRGDVAGALATVFAPIAESVRRDPARFLGGIIGFSMLAVLGKSIAAGIASRFRMPGLVRLEALITNLLQLDPIGLVIDYIAGPATKIGLSKLAVAWGISPERIGRIVGAFVGAPLTKVVELFRSRIAGLARQFSQLATLIYGWGDDIKRVYGAISDIKARKGINYLIALRNQLVGADQRFRSLYTQLTELARSLDPKGVKSRPVALLQTATKADVDSAVRALSNFDASLKRLSSVLGVQIDYARLAGTSIENLLRLRDELRRAVQEISDVAWRFSLSISELDSYIRQRYPDVYSRIRSSMDYASLTRSVNPFEAQRQVANIVSTIYREFGFDVARDIALRWAGILEGSGFGGLANQIRAVVSEFDGVASRLLDVLRRFEAGVAERALSRIASDPGISNALRMDQVVKAVKEGVRTMNLASLSDALSGLIRGIDQVVATARSLNTVDVARRVLDDVRRSINDLVNGIRELRLDEFKRISSGVAEIDRLGTQIDDIVRRLSDVEARLRVEYESTKPLVDLANSLGLAKVAETIQRMGLGVREAQELILNSIALKSIDDATRIVESVSKFVKSIENTPQFYAFRAFLSNIEATVNARLRDAVLPPDLVRSVSEFRARHPGLPPAVAKAADEVISNPRVSSMIRFIDSLLDVIGQLKPGAAAGFDIAMVARIIDEVESMLKRARDPKIQLPDVGATLDKIDTLRKRMQGIKTELVEVRFRLVDPGLKQAIDTAADELRRSFKLMSREISGAADAMKRFLDLVYEGRFDEAWRMYGQVKDAARLFWILGLAGNIRDAIVRGLRTVRDRIAAALGREVQDTAQARAVSQAVDEVAKFLERSGAVEIKPGYGFIASSVDEVIGYTIRAPIDVIDEVVELLTLKRKDFTVSVGDARMRVVREVSKTPLDLRVRYSFETPQGNAYIEVVVRTVEFDPATRRAVNVAVVNYWYDPPLQESIIGRRLGEEMSRGYDFIKAVDPDIDVLSKVVTNIPQEVSLGTVIARAVSALGTAMLAATRMREVAGLDPKAAFIVSQPSLRTLLNMVSEVSPVPESIYGELIKIGFVPIGMAGQLVIGRIATAIPRNVGYVEVGLPSGERVVLPSVPELGVILVPLYVPVEKPPTQKDAGVVVQKQIDYSQIKPAPAPPVEEETPHLVVQPPQPVEVQPIQRAEQVKDVTTPAPEPERIQPPQIGQVQVPVAMPTIPPMRPQMMVAVQRPPSIPTMRLRKEAGALAIGGGRIMGERVRY